VKALGRFFRRLGAVPVTLVAACLPWRARLAWLGFVDTLAHPGRMRETRFFRWQMRLWNRVLLGLVFVLGLLPARLFFPLWGRKHLAPRAGSGSYWVERQPPETQQDQVEDPF
jgi:hypothetical protein